MISFHVTGDFKKTDKFLHGVPNLPKSWRTIMKRYGDRGLEALKRLTPKDSGITASAWTYKIDGTRIIFENSSRVGNSSPLVVLLQYGHATHNGGYVKAIDFINPALRPIFDQIAIECWKEVEKL